METHEDSIDCTNCNREIRLGEDLFVVEKGVAGLRGIVPLDEKLVFCGEECVGEFFESNETTSTVVSPRIP